MKKIQKFWKSWDLLDGRRRGEVIARRLYVLLSILAMLLMLTSLYAQQSPVTKVVTAQEPEGETVLKSGDVVNGVEVRVHDDGSVWYVAEVTPEVKEPVQVQPKKEATLKVDDKVLKFVTTYNGSRIDRSYLEKITVACGGNTKKVKSIVAIALSETGLGRDVKKKTNFYGYHLGGASYDPSLDTIVKNMCKAVGGSYKNLPAGESVAMYVYGRSYSKLNASQKEGVKAWQGRYNWAMKEMK